MRTLSALILALAIVGSGRAGILDWIIPKHDVEVIAVTDTTPVGALRRAASPANPVYYTAISAGYRDLGGIIAGEKIPNKDEVLKTIAKVLAKQGYLPATDAHQPSLLLVWTWGTMNTDRWYSGNPDDTDGRQINRNQLMRFMGAYKLGMVSKDAHSAWQDEMFPMSGMLFRNADQDMIFELASEDLYVAAIAAYDYSAALRKEKTLLWTTKISCPSRGLSMPETLPAMLALAGPYIGRETTIPVSIKATDKFKPEVKIGDPTVVEYIDNAKLPVVEVAPDTTKKKAPAPKKKRK
jgi:hypothetical protein